MNHLDALKKRLQNKPDAKPAIPVIVKTSQDKKIEEPKANIVKKTNIMADRDKGELSTNILEKIKKQKISRLDKTRIEEEKTPFII